MEAESSAASPTREELNAELVEVPEPPEQPEPVDAPDFEEVVARALRHARAKRGGDLVGVILVGSGARRAVTPHSDVDLIALVKGQAEADEIIRISDRLVDIRYRGYKTVKEELGFSPRLPPLLRKGRILFDYDGMTANLIDQANLRFRQGPPPATLNEQIRLKAECYHWLGKAEDLFDRPATALFLLNIFFEDFLSAFFRLRGFWLTAPMDMLRFLSSRDPALGELASQFLSAPNLSERLNSGRQLADLLFKDVPNPARVD
jgi:predicted nucleotidyltransferase